MKPLESVRSSVRRGAALALGALILAGGALARQEPAPATFDPAADARADVAHATEVATKKHKRVLVVFGHEGRADDVALYRTLKRGKTEAWPFYYEFQLVAVDAGADGSANTELAEALGAPAERPLLSVLDAAGKPLAHRGAAAFLGEGGWSEQKLGAFLTPHAVEPLDANQVLKSALERATKEQKRLFVHLGAPW